MTSPVSGGKRADIQGLRAVAVLMVVAFHAGLPVPGGFIGVDVFFVISGFVITAMLEREWTREGGIRFTRFYSRRFKRLTPALALMLAATMVMSALILSPLGPQENAAKTALGAIFLIANFVIARTTGDYFGAPAETNPLLNTWSLSVEEQFYLAFPAVLLVCWLLARRKRSLRAAPILIVAVIAFTSFALAVAGGFGLRLPASEFILGFYSPFTRAWEFAVGSILALAIAGGRLKTGRWANLLGVVGAVLLAISLWAITPLTVFPGLWTLLPVTGAMLLLAAGVNSSNAISRGLATRPMAQIGDWSYSIYLWHWPFIVFAAILWPDNWLAVPLAAAASLIPALLAYQWVEQPFRRMAVPKWPRATVLAAAVVLPPAILAVGLGILSTQVLRPMGEEATQTESFKAHAVYRQACVLEADHPIDGPCIWEPNAPGAPVYLLGDSNAAQFAEALIGATASLDRPLTAQTANSCPLLDIRVIVPGQPGYEETCQAWVNQALESTTASEPGVVVLGASDQYWLYPYTIVLPDGTKVTDEAGKIQAMQDSLQRTVDRLQAAGHKVVLVQTIPHFADEYEWNPARCSLNAVLNGECTRDMPLDYALARSAAPRDAVRIVAERTGSQLLDLADEICPQSECSTSRPDVGLIYSDGKHVTVKESESLVGAFEGPLSQ